METIFNVDYFIKKFEPIPEHSWLVGDYSDGAGRRCAAGWCGHHRGMQRYTKEGESLIKILYPLYIADINDGKCKEYEQPTPKQRILAALRDIKAKQDIDGGTKTEAKERIVYVTVDKDVRELQQKELVTN